MEPLAGRRDLEFETMAGGLVAEIERRVNVEIDPLARYAFAAVDAYRDSTEFGQATIDELAWAYEI